MRRFHRGQRGFTLIELLVVMAILAILAAIAVPTVLHFTSSAKSDAAVAELANVQAAMDNMMTDRELSSVTAVTTPTNNMRAFPSTTNYLYPPAGYETGYGYSSYMRSATTTGTYTCTSNGTVSQATY